MQEVAIWGGVMGMVVSLITLLIIFFIKKDINDLLNRDAILFDQNFSIKKQAIEKSFKLLDDLEQSPNIAGNPEFIRRAKEAYNELLCVLNNISLAEQFRALSLNQGQLNKASLTKYKVECRRDIGLSMKAAGKLLASNKSTTQTKNKK